MTRTGLRKTAEKLLGEAKAVVRAFPRQKELAEIVLTDPIARAESFACRQDEEVWFELAALHSATRRAKRGSDVSAAELRTQMRRIEWYVSQI